MANDGDENMPRFVSGVLWVFRAWALALVTTLEFVGWVFFVD